MKLLAGVVGGFLFGALSGAVGLLWWGAPLGEHILQLGVRLANAGTTPVFRVEAGTAVSQTGPTPDVVPVALPVSSPRPRRQERPRPTVKQ
jgi:hypothetical protein